MPATTTAPAADDATDTVDPTTNAREVRIAELADKEFANLQRAELHKPPAERDKDKVLWKQARKTAKAQVRREEISAAVKKAVSSAAMSLYADGRSACSRNRKQLAPWLLTVPYAMTGEAAYLLAEYGTGTHIGVSAVAAATTAAGSWIAWRRKLASATPAPFAERMKAALGLLCGWTAAMPLVPGAGQAGLWLSLVGGAAFMGLPWWRQHDHPIPLPADLAGIDLSELGDFGTEAPAQRVPTEVEKAFAEQTIADWAQFVAGMGTLPGSTLTAPKRIEYGWTFQLNLVRGKQKITDVRTAKDNFAAALNHDPAKITIDGGADQTTVVLTLITDGISNVYDGPRIVREGGDIFIEVGPYEDGIGSERFHVLAGQLTAEELAAGEQPRGSMNGGFALGTKGSGKSRLIEEIAVGLRRLGIEIWYLDPQCGKSSPALDKEADWPLSGVHGTRGPFSNVVDLWKAMKAVTELRAAESAGEPGFQHTRERPAILAYIDECHGVFQAENPETGNSFGADFADIDREMRKNGLGLFGASQAITQDTFGSGNKAAVLRDGMCAVNVYLMSYGGKNLGLAPGYDGQPCASLATNLGLGYNPKGRRPHMRWQSRYTSDFQPWLAKYPKATLDARAQKRIGNTYLKRFETHTANKAALQAWLDTIDACEGDASMVPGLGQQQTGDAKKTASTAKVLNLMSPAQRRMQATGGSATATATAVADPPGVDVALTAAERKVLEIVRAEPQNPTTLGRALEISSQGAGKHLKSLAEQGVVLKMEDGRYMAR